MDDLKDKLTKWVEALESGEYQQTKGTLKRKLEDGSFGYCCLGVYESINAREPEAVDFDSYDQGSKNAYEAIKKELRDESVGVVDIRPLMVMNDDGKSFKEIAQHIRNEYL